MTANRERMYWMTNKEWYFINENNQFELTDKAPERAIKSFELYNSNERKNTTKS